MNTLKNVPGFVICAGLTVFLLCGCASRKDNGADASLARHNSEIEKRVALDIAGHYRILQIKIDHSSTNFYNWLGVARIERYGKSGVEYTNLLYRYYGCGAWYPLNQIVDEHEHQPALRVQAARLLEN